MYNRKRQLGTRGVVFATAEITREKIASIYPGYRAQAPAAAASLPALAPASQKVYDTLTPVEQNLFDRAFRAPVAAGAPPQSAPTETALAKAGWGTSTKTGA